MRQVTYKGLSFVPYIENARIQARIKELASQIKTDCGGKRPCSYVFSTEHSLLHPTFSELSMMTLK